jgi:hypothetical protein
MTTQLQQEEKTAKRLPYWLIPIVVILSLIVWFIREDIPTGYSILFLFHQAPLLIFVPVIAIGWFIIYLIGVTKQWDTFQTRLWPHVLMIGLLFTMWAMIGFNRYQCGNDINVSSRYKTYANGQGWDR